MKPEADEGDGFYANPATRDAFLNALDGDDRLLMLRLARLLESCANALPGLTRETLGLPAGATYGMAARHILALHPMVAPEDGASPERHDPAGHGGR